MGAVLFLSDGRPTDSTEVILGRVTSLSERFGQQLSIATLGFASRDHDFSMLERMAKGARDAGGIGEFNRPEMSLAGLGTAVAHSVSLTVTKMGMIALEEQRVPPRLMRHVQREVACAQWEQLAPARKKLKAS